MDEKKDKLKIFYKNIDKFSETSLVNGVFGGYSPEGMLVVNFYFDRKSFPEELEIQHIEHNVFGNENPISFEKNVDVIREIVSKIGMTPQTAKRIGKWLIDRAEKAEKRSEN
ncbi:MAG TPA: hypothetical protein VKN74_08240 [Candidatus Mcinerneyibacterium sp.]|nr:hypothetical protein [Candidatus Mcinerneyibacterium sp.]